MRVLVKSVYDAFEYVMAHYYPAGLEEFAQRRDTYAVISIQDTHTGGFGICFTENRCCKGVLTLLFDDVWKEDVKGAVCFSEEMARQVIAFIDDHRNVDTLLVHCYAGQSRSRAVGAFALWMLEGDETVYSKAGSPNPLVYQKLMKVYKDRSVGK